MARRLLPSVLSFLLCVAIAPAALSQTVTVDTSAAGRQQTIDGFGTCLANQDGSNDWFKTLYFDDLEASILRVDLTPPFASPYSDLRYNSPWYGQDPNIESGGGPEGNNVRTYTSAEDYTRMFGGRQAEIAVMGPDIDENIKRFDFEAVKIHGELAQLGQSKSGALGGFKLYGSMWSPAPWLKISSGNQWPGGTFPLPPAGVPWPFIWGGNFAGGMLDTSDTPLSQFDDKAAGGTGPTSALTQFGRSLAAYLKGFQQTYGVRFYAISIQNEVNFEEFYNSCSYPLSEQYIKALVAARTELDKHADLKDILIAGPEDLMGGDGWGMWQYGGGSDVTHKNLQYLANVAADPAAASALAFFNIHGYAPDGASSAGGDPTQWRWWVDGWTTAPAQGLPAQVDGFRKYGKKSWMTETSGEQTAWLSPSSGFPKDGAFSIAIKIHQALTAGRESAWIYWQLSDGKDVAEQTLTDSNVLEGSPKYVAARHFFKFIRPGAVAVTTQVAGSDSLYASAYLHEGNGTLTVVLVNADSAAATANLSVPTAPEGIQSFEVVTSSDGNFNASSTLSVNAGTADVPVPGYGVVTLVGAGKAIAVPDAGVEGGTGADASTDAAADGAAGSDSGAPSNPDGGGGAKAAPGGGDEGGCGCVAAGRRGRGELAWIAVLLAVGGLGRARRRRR